MQAKFASGGDISEMKMEDDLMALKLDANEDPKNILDKIADVLVRCSCFISSVRKAAIVMRMGKEQYSTAITTDTVMIWAV